ncbi:MAG: hypothetical protein VZR36_03395 [Prevotella sp.]|jgi:hypothetical protein|nr:hypothetical protein [Prevotella sp.]
MEKLIKYRKVVLALSLTWWIDITFRLLGRLGEWVGWLSFGLCALLVLLNIILFIGMLARDMKNWWHHALIAAVLVVIMIQHIP